MGDEGGQRDWYARKQVTTTGAAETRLWNSNFQGEWGRVRLPVLPTCVVIVACPAAFERSGLRALAHTLISAFKFATRTMRPRHIVHNSVISKPVKTATHVTLPNSVISADSPLPQQVPTQAFRQLC